MTDLVKLYNPANAASLTPEQLAGLQKLTSAEIKELAQAYPNITMQRAYLLIIDQSKAVEKQLPQLSTFQNLWNLREKNGLKHFVPYSFLGTYKTKNISPIRTARREVIDLSEVELLSLPGFKTANREEKPQEVKVTKIKKAVSPLENSMKEIDSLESVKPEFQKKFFKLPEEKPKLKSIKK